MPRRPTFLPPFLPVVHQLLSSNTICPRTTARAELIGAAVIPHGDFVYAPELIDHKNGSGELHEAAKKLGRMIREQQPDTVFLSTPHGLELSEAFLVYQNADLAGVARLGGDVQNGTVSIDVRLRGKTDQDLVAVIKRELGDGPPEQEDGSSRKKHMLRGTAAGTPSHEVEEDTPEKNKPYTQQYRLESLQGFADGYPLPLNWGEIVPLSFLSDTIEHEDVATTSRIIRPRSTASSRPEVSWSTSSDEERLLVPAPKLVVLGVPLRRYNHSTEMVPELLRLGADLADIFERSSKRVLWVVSADLAHTHLASGPYGYCVCAQPFDDAVNEWVRNFDGLPQSAEKAAHHLLVDARREQKAGALSCGFTGLVMLQGGLGWLSSGAGEERGEEALWRGEVLAEFHPTYYGMMVAKFARVGGGKNGTRMSSSFEPKFEGGAGAAGGQYQRLRAGGSGEADHVLYG